MFNCYIIVYVDIKHNTQLLTCPLSVYSVNFVFMNVYVFKPYFIGLISNKYKITTKADIRKFVVAIKIVNVY